MTEQQAIEALHALPRLPRSGASLERMQALPPWKPGKAV